MAVSEMVTANSALWNTAKTRRRCDHTGEVRPVSVQIAGGEAQMMADAARRNVDLGAEIIDINMGCPEKKVCHRAAGSALLRDENLVGQILDSVAAAVDALVTLKIRTGWDRQYKNAVRVARMAESAGVQAIAIHGRTRADLFNGEAEYETIAEVKSRIGIPVIANGDIDTPHKARQVLDRTGADAVMIGRAAQGRPWIFREVGYFLDNGKELGAPSTSEIQMLLVEHVGWYTRTLDGGEQFRRRMNKIESAKQQISAIRLFFDDLANDRANNMKTLKRAA